MRKSKVTNKEAFLKALSTRDGECKWYRYKNEVYVVDVTTATIHLPFGCNWNYAFSDELECVKFDEIFAEVV